MALIDVEGVDQLTMRRLGQRLGVDPMAVYYHVPNKAAVFDGIVEHLWGAVTIPTLEPGESWQDFLAHVFTDFRARLLEHPRAVVVVGTRPATSATMLRLIDDALGRLTGAGLPGTEAMQLIDCLSGFTIGKVLAETGETLGGPAPGAAQALASVTAQTHPHLGQALAFGYAFAPDEGFARGLRALIDGWH